MTTSEHSLPETEERLGSRLRRARIHAALFQKPSPQVKVERFTLLERIGAGSMGEVFSAYDERLDRKIALKLVRGDLHASSDANQRLLREAKTLAQVSHPNVVSIYDAGLFEDRVFIAMEFIRGNNMTRWLQSIVGAPRRDVPRRDQVREILRHFIAAGRGLEAAHGAGLTHRDFKPDNILVGEDGRVRVVDFGLARSQDRPALAAAEDAPAATEDESDDALTDERASGAGRASHPMSSPSSTPSGTLTGTPAYMAPELYRGHSADSRSDQFSFCVALYEALYGRRPFEGEDISALEAAITKDEPNFSARESVVPASVRKALARGMAKKPADRFADMGRLLRALEERPRRWGAVVLGLMIVAAMYVYSRSDTTAVCQGGAQEMAEVWNPSRSRAVQQAITATRSSYADEAWPLVDRGLQQYARAWTSMHRDACLAHRQGSQSALMLDMRMACLEQRRSALEQAVSVLEEIDAQTLSQAVIVVESLPSVEYCANTQALRAKISPPEEPVLQARVVDLRERLSRAEALEHSGRLGDAHEVAQHVVAATRALDYRPLLAEALLIEGRVAMKMDATRRELSIEPLRDAAVISLELGIDAVTVEAFARLVYVQGTLPKGSVSLLESVPMFEALARRLPESAFARVLLLNNLGVVHLARKDRDQARAYFERAVAAQAVDGPIELIVAANNLAMVTSDVERRVALMQDVARRFDTILGRSHPQTLRQRVNYSSYIVSPKVAYDTLTPACEQYQQSSEPNIEYEVLSCWYKLAFLAAELGDRDQAEAVLHKLIARASSKHQDIRALADGYARLYGDQPDAALVPFQAVIDDLPDAPEGWWLQKPLGDAYLGIGVAHQALARRVDAIQALTRALAIFERLTELSYKTEYGHRLAWTRAALATSLGADEASRARTLLIAAQTWYREAGPGYERRDAELEAALSRIPAKATR